VDGKNFLFFGAGIVILGAACFFSGIRFNFTGSEPNGVYRVTEITKGLSAGDLVVACPPERAARLSVERGYVFSAGKCPGGSFPFMKKIVAVPGDRVQVSRVGIFVNGILVKNSLPRKVDSRGNPVPGIMGYDKITSGYWLVSSYSGLSYDSRYWGAIPAQSIFNYATPVFVFGSGRGN